MPEEKPQSDAPEASSRRAAWLAEIRHHGWRWWISLLRRGAPWVLLVFALAQVKRLNDRVRDVESQEFQVVEREARELREGIHSLQMDLAETRRTMTKAQVDLRLVDDSLAEMRRRAPSVALDIGAAQDAVASLRRGLPKTESASALSEQLQMAVSASEQVRGSLPPPSAALGLSTTLTALMKSVEDVRSALPDPKGMTQLTTSLDASSRRLEALGKVLPTVEHAQALSELLDSQLASLRKLQKTAAAAEHAAEEVAQGERADRPPSTALSPSNAPRDPPPSPAAPHPLSK